MPDVDGEALLAASVRFGRALHAEGLAADLTGARDFARALTMVEIGDREVVRAAGAAIFVRHVDEIGAYRRVFDRFWRVSGGMLEGPAPARRRQPGPSGLAADAKADAELIPGLSVRRVGYSAAERLRHRDFATLTPA